MRKFMTLIRNFFAKNLLSSILSGVLLTFVTLQSLVAYGNYRTVASSLGLATPGEEYKEIYYCFQNRISKLLSPDEYDDIREKLKTLPGTELVGVNYIHTGTVNGKQIDVIMYDRDMLDLFPNIEGRAGKIGEDGCLVYNEGGNRKKGDELIIELFGGKEYKYRVAGTLGKPSYYFYMNGFSTFSYEYSIDMMVSRIMSDTVIIEATEDIVDSTKYMMPQGTFFVVVKNDATKEERQEVIDLIRSNFSVNDYSEMLDGMQKQFGGSLKVDLTMPVFMLLFSFLAFMTFCAVSVSKKARESAVFFLLGCDIGKCRMIVLVSVSLVALVSVALGTFLTTLATAIWRDSGSVLFYNLLRWMRQDEFIFGTDLLILALVILLFYLVIAYVTTRIVISRSSPIELLRKKER